jgi:MoaA/NifB/PqqE/SkfB family radical SAM enzyme
MFVEPTTLSLITTHKCTAACDHCCFHCTPKVEIRIPPERLEGIIEEAARLKSLRVVVFTGGECFLIPELDDRIAQVTRLKLASRCVTNGCGP